MTGDNANNPAIPCLLLPFPQRRLLTLACFGGRTMGIHDRDWYQAEQRMRRQRESVEFSRAAKWAMFRAGAFRTLVNCLAVYGAMTLLLRVIKWFSG
jgi:hypothetical protein